MSLGVINDSYICSSNWMRDAYRRRPNDFKRKILKRDIPNLKLMFDEEARYLSLIKKEELGKKYYNLHNVNKKHWSTNEEAKLTIGQKISIKNKNDPRRSEWMKNRIVSEKTKEKLRQANLGKKYSSEINDKKGGNRDYTDIEFRNKMSIAAKNRSEETRKKISENNKRLQAEGKIGMLGKKHSPETIEKMKLSALNRKLNNNSFSLGVK